MWKWLLGAYLAFVLLFFAFIGAWTWARDDFFASQLMLSAPPQSSNRIAVVSDSDLQGDANHSLRPNFQGKWQKWTDVGTQSEMADQKWQLLWSRDGSLVALRENPGMSGNPRVKVALYTRAFDFKSGKSHETFDSGEEPQHPFSRTIEAMMERRGGAVAGRQTKRELGVWRWQDRDLKDAAPLSKP